MPTISYSSYDMTVDQNDPNRIFESGSTYTTNGELVSATINEQDANKYIFDNFNAFDKDGNGALTQTEITQRLDTLGVDNRVENIFTGETLSNNHHERIYEKYIAPADLDNNGEVTAQELQDKYGLVTQPKADVVTNPDPAAPTDSPSNSNLNNAPGEQIPSNKQPSLWLIDDNPRLISIDDWGNTENELEKLFRKTVSDAVLKAFSTTGINTNGDLFITEKEALAAGSTQAEFADQLKLCDINSDNKISLGETFYELNNQQEINLQEFSNSYGEDAAKALKQYDLDNDGTVTQDEIKAHDKELDKSNDSIIDKFKNLSTEAKVGIIIAGVVVIAAIVALIVALATRKKKKNTQLNAQQQVSAAQPGMMPQAYMMPMQPQMYYMPQYYAMPQANYGYSPQNVGYSVSNNLNSINQSQGRQM